MTGRIQTLVLVLLICSTHAYAQNTSVLLNSEAGDYIGQGVGRTLTTEDGVFTPTRNFANGVSISFYGTQLGSFWLLNFAAPEGAELGVGIYEGARRFPFQPAASPGLDVIGEGRGCNTLTGRFEVLEASFGTDGSVERFAADFEQHCEGASAALFGSVRFNSTIGAQNRCTSRTYTISGLRTAVGLLTTNSWRQRTLTSILARVERAANRQAFQRARGWLATFIGQAVDSSDSHRVNESGSLDVDAINGLVCAAANVMTNLPVDE